jgi:sigma-70-like protein
VIEFERRRTGQPAPAHGDAEVARISVSADPGVRLTRRGRFLADPRRRFGRHAEARRLLAEDAGQASSIKPGVWDGLLTALRRHTIQASLASLAAGERQVLHMAYLEGRTNREIAAILSISRSTVRRRIVLGLANLDSQIRRAGTWASTVLLLLLASAVARARIVVHPVSALRATPAGNAILTSAAVAVAGAVVFGAVVSNQSSAGGDHGPSRSLPKVTAGAPLSVSALPPFTSTTDVGRPSEPTRGKTTGSDTAGGTSHVANGSLDPGCDGNPTSAPPSTPVGPRGADGSKQSPVTHPRAGGCGPHGVEGP